MRANVIAACCIAMLFLPMLGHAQNPAPVNPRKPELFHIVQTLQKEDRFASFCFSPDGKVLAVADGSEVHFWDPRTGKSVREPWKCDANLGQLAFVDRKTLALVDASETSVSMREYPSGKTVGSFASEKKQSIRAIAGAEGMVAVVSGSGFRLLTAPHCREAWKVELKVEKAIRTIAISPDRSEVAVAGWWEIGVYATKDGKLRHRVEREAFFSPRLSGIAYSPDGRQIAFCPSKGDPKDIGMNEIGVTISDTQFTQSRDFRWSNARRYCPNPVGCQFSPDGKTLLVLTEFAEVRLYELATGGLRRVGLTATSPHRVAFSPDGRLFAFAGREPGVSVMDWRAVTSGSSTEWDAKALWADLASPDSEKGYWAVVALGANPAEAAKLLGEKLKPDPASNTAVKTWIGDLGSEDFAQRETAEKELAKLGGVIEGELREAAKSESPETRDRAIRLLRACTRATDPNRLRILRAVEVLEYIDTPASRSVLKAFANGAPGSLLTRDAKAALERLQDFAPKP